jgi:minor extracellular serine protease Vpr
MNRRVLFIALSMTLALSMQGFTGVLRSAKVQAKAGSASAPVQTTAATAGTVAAIVVLENEPVAVHQRLAERIPQREIDFEAPSARAYEAQLDGEHAGFISRAALVSPNLRVRTELRKLVNAVSIEVSDGDLAAIAALPGVKRVELVKEYHSLLDASVPLINAPALWDRLGGVGVAGQGMKIAILDTGIDITNPLFSDTGYSLPSGFPKTNNGSTALTNNKVIAAKSFIRPASDAHDGNGHGSNVAGIAAGSVASSPLGTISGVAPMAYLGNYRVLDASGSGGTDLIARGIEEAVSDGFDVLSMSFGGPADNSFDVSATAAEAAVAAGRVVVIAAGNDGPDTATISSPGIAPSAITVAASTNAHIVGPVINVANATGISNLLTGVGSTLGAGSSAVFDSALGPMPYVDPDPQGRACSSLPSGSLTGKIALIERGNCNFVNKINNVAAAGAVAVIIFNRDPSEDTPGSTGGGDNLFTMDATGTTIPSFFIVRSRGLALRSFLAANPGATLSIATFGSGSFTPDVLADFSSRGPSSLGALKPDVAAPGVIIYSAAARTGDPVAGVVDPSGFLAISGTSQATPHVAGSAALIKQLNPSFTPEQVKSALMNSATTDVFTTADQTTRVGVLDNGGGRVDLARASSVSGTFSPTSLSFGIRKLKAFDVTASIDLQITSVVDGQNNFTVNVQQLNPGAGITVTPSTGSLALARGQTRTATITIMAIAGSQRRDYTGYIVVTGGGQTLHVPYWIRYVKKKA